MSGLRDMQIDGQTETERRINIEHGLH